MACISAQLTSGNVWTPFGAALALLLVLVAGWIAERQQAARRRTMQRLYQFGEELIAAKSSAEVLRLLESVLPELLGVSEVGVYLLDRASGTLQRLKVDAGAGLSLVPVRAEEQIAFRERSVELCFRNRSLLAIPDTRRSPLFEAAQARETPRSMLFIPMFALEDLLGVLTVGVDRRGRTFSEDQRAALQHLGNQTAIGIRLREQRSLREHTMGTGQLDAFSQLVAAAAGEMKQPLAAIVERSRSLPVLSDVEVQSISAAAGLADGMLSRLLQFSRLHRDQNQLTDLASVLRELLSDREAEWQKRGLHLRDLVSPEPLTVAAPEGSIEPLIASLLWHSAHGASGLTDGTFTARAFRLATTAQADFTWSERPAAGQSPDPLDDTTVVQPGVFSLGLCRALAAFLGGRLQISTGSEGGRRLELELPLAQMELLETSEIPQASSHPGTPLTTLVLEPDHTSRQALLALLSELGHRGVVASNSAEAVELTKRMGFHIFFCAQALGGSLWQECYQDVRSRVKQFVLLTQGRDAALTAALPGGEASTLALPLRREELGRLLAEVGGRLVGAGR